MPERDLQWLVLEDFSAGIVQRTNAFVAGSPAPSRRAASAQVSGTYGCVALPGGGLGPLPGRQTTISMGTTLTPTLANATGGYVNVGLGNLSPVRDMGSVQPFVSPFAPFSVVSRPDALYLFTAWYSSPSAGNLQRNLSVSQIEAYGLSTGRGVNHVVPQYFNFYKSDASFNQLPQAQLGGDRFPNLLPGVWSGTTNNITTGTYPNVPGLWASVPGLTTQNNSTTLAISNNSFQLVGETTVVFNGLDSLPGAPLVVKDASGNYVNGMLLLHQGRAVVSSYENEYFSPATGAISFANTNEYVSWTDPPGSTGFVSPFNTSLLQKALFYPEFWHGYGTGRSTNAGELFLVKHRGGAVLISGDLNNPAAYRLPSVTSTGGVCGPGAQSSMGFVYLTSTGAYVWRGGDASTKISHQLDDLFFNTSSGPGVASPLSRLVVSQCQAEEWNDYVMVTGGWLFDTNSSSWWRLDNPAVTNLQWFTRSYYGNVMYAAELQWAQAGDPILYIYDRYSPTQFFTWRSNPIVVNNNRTVEIPEAVVYAQGTGTVTVTISGTAVTAGSNSATFAVSSATPVAIRKPIATQASPVVVTITSQGSGINPAPVLHALHLGWREAPAKLNRF